MHLEHVAINVPEPAAMAQWLVDNLEMRIVSAQKDSPYAHFIADNKGSMIELYNNPAAPMPDYAQIDPFNLHFAFATDDIDAAVKNLVDAGAELVGQINANPLGDRLAFLRSPWQVTIQFVQRAKPML